MASICFDSSLHVTPTDLGIEIRGDIVTVPEELRNALDSMGVRSVDALASALQSFPTAFASQLGLDVPTVMRSRVGALKKLQGVLGEALVQPVDPSTRRGMGALPPGWLKSRRG
jgi:hypothetical protein